MVQCVYVSTYVAMCNYPIHFQQLLPFLMHFLHLSSSCGPRVSILLVSMDDGSLSIRPILIRQRFTAYAAILLIASSSKFGYIQDSHFSAGLLSG